MTTRTVVGDAGVVEAGRQPGVVAVAAIALLCGLNVVRRFAGCRGAVVTGRAAALNFGVIDCGDRTPAIGAVARVAHVGAGDVTARFAGCRRAVVTARA